jgi:hypothetical protein
MTTTYKGMPACECQVKWLTAFERELADLKMPKLEIAQLIGNAPASAGRHLGGGNIDWWTTDVKTARLSRENGGLAMIRDGSRDSFDNNQHTHTYLPGCPHMSDGAKRDMAEVLRGGDGLIGDVPDDPRLKGAWKQGDAWQKGVARMTARQMKRKRLITFGTHNTLDGAGRETPFADVIIFTEAMGRQVRAGLERTHRVWVCKQQKDLVLAVHQRLNPRMVGQEYRKVHGGRVLVTPKRGSWRTDLDLLEVPVSGVWDHRINAAWPPFIRGEEDFRPRMWKKHDGVTNAMIRDAKHWAHVVLAGGDPNTPKRVDAYDSLRYEVGEGKDRLASNRELTDVQELSKAGSDHHRLRASVQL